MQEQQSKCDSCADLEADVLSLNNRLQSLEHSTVRIREGFLKNDLGLPDYDGHRTAHKSMVEQASVIDGYKRDATKTVVGWLLAAVVGMFSVGFFDWFKSHLK